MHRRIKNIFLLMSFFLLCLALTACGASRGKVPDSYISAYLAEKCDISEWSFTTKHDYDSKSHIDTVLVLLTDEGQYGSCNRQVELKYQYDRSSDLWFLFAESEWADKSYTYNDNLIGEWSFSGGNAYNPNAHYDITLNITSVNSTKLTADCSVYYKTAYVDVTHSRGQVEFDITLDESGIYDVNQIGHINIPMHSPDGYYPETVNVVVELSINSGPYRAIYDGVLLE